MNTTRTSSALPRQVPKAGSSEAPEYQGRLETLAVPSASAAIAVGEMSPRARLARMERRRAMVSDLFAFATGLGRAEHRSAAGVTRGVPAHGLALRGPRRRLSRG